MQGITRKLIHQGISWHDYNALLQTREESAEPYTFLRDGGPFLKGPEPQPELPLPGNPPAGQDSHLARAIDVGRIAIAARIRHGERLSSLRGEIANLTLAEDVLLGVEELPSGTD